MLKGRNTHTIGQVGEYLTVAQLCRMGLIATTFTRNVPYFDILAINDKHQTTPIQVKTISGSTWQFDAIGFLDISISNGKQKLIGKKKLQNSNMICVFVKLISLGKDQFYLLRIKDLQNIIYKDYSRYLTKHKGRRPKVPTSTHTAVPVEALAKYRDNWKLIK